MTDDLRSARLTAAQNDADLDAFLHDINDEIIILRKLLAEADRRAARQRWLYFATGFVMGVLPVFIAVAMEAAQ